MVLARRFPRVLMTSPSVVPTAPAGVGAHRRRPSLARRRIGRRAQVSTAGRPPLAPAIGCAKMLLPMAAWRATLQTPSARGCAPATARWPVSEVSRKAG